MTSEVASEVSSYTCLHPLLQRPGGEGWGGAGVVERVVEAGRTTAPGVHRVARFEARG